MSKRISREKANELYEKDMMLRDMQRQGITLPKSRRRKKYEMMCKRQNNFIDRLINRIKRNDGKLPDHLKGDKVET